MNDFTCAACGGTFEKCRSEEDAVAEAVELWGSLLEGPVVVICDDCFNAGMRRIAH